jgi:PAS domain S-box-containing protein
MKIRSYLLVLTAAALLPLVVFSALITGVLWNVQQSAQEQRFSERVKGMSIALDRELLGSTRVLELLAQSTSLESEDLGRFYGRARRVRDQEKGWQTIILAEASGREIFDVRRPFGSPLREQVDGATLQHAIRARRPVVSRLLGGPGPGEFRTFIAVPVGNRQGTQHVLLAEIDAASWLSFLRTYPIAADATMTLLDQDGHIIARTLDHARWVGKPAPSELWERSRESALAAYRTTGLEGDALYSAHSRSVVSGWTMATGVPAAAVNRVLWKSTLAMAGAVVLAIALAGALALLLSRKAARPISALARLSAALSGGTPPPPDEPGLRISEVDDVARVLYQAAADRRMNEARFEVLTQLAPAGLFQTDAGGGYVYVNDQWSAITGISRQQATGAGWIDALHEDDRERVTRHWDDAIKLQCDFSAEYRLRRTEGEERWVTAQARPVRNWRDTVVSHVGFITDATDLKRAAERREELLERIQAARRAAESASHAKDEFLGVVSHELRNPLNSIQLWLEVLRPRAGDHPQIARALEFIKRAADTQTKLIDDLLDVARIESGKLRMEVVTVPLGPIVTAAQDSVRLAVAAKGITLELRLAEGSLAVTGDSSRLQQVASNLLSNAVKFTPKGGKVEVSLRRTDSHARLIVKDDGEGIAPEFLPHIFERFRQADASSTRNAPGMGLGLSIARQLVELHGGRIWAESPGKGKGATFFVDLPLAPAIAVLAESRGRDDNKQMALVHGLRLLVVEDEPGAREALAFLLRSVGARVATAGSVGEALDLLDRERFDVMVSDIGMPGQDGYGLIRQLRQRPRNHGGGTPSIALTAYAGVDNERRALSAGYQMHLAKPIRPSALTEAIANLARSRSDELSAAD